MTTTLSGRERACRSNIRNFLYPLTLREMQVELDMAILWSDPLRIRFITEYMDETRNEEG